MKKALLLLASAAMLLVGCAKEKFAEPNDGGLTSVTFSASVDGGVATKAAAYNDGNGAYVNRCIMEIYFQNQLYKRMEAAMSETPATATFANVPVVAGKEYQILFWADCGGAEKSDLYYTTTSLKAVTVAKTAFIGALEAGDNDKLDAFFFAETRSIPQSGDNSYTVSLKRPFAQLNVITTDVAEGKTVTSEDLLPEKVSVSYEAANTINVATGETSKVGQTEADYTFAYEAPVYGETDSWSDVKDRGELTLSMDYILASNEQGTVDVTFITKNGGQAVMTHSLTNLPYQRNYRTNVKGDLLTTAGSWKAEIDPEWAQPDIVKVVEVADIHSANEIINQYKETTDHLEVKFTAEPNDSGEPTGAETSPAKAIVTTPIKEGKTLSIEVLADTKKLYIGDYPNEYTVTSVDTDNAKPAVVNVNVPIASKIENLFINAPTKSVYINGKEVANVGTITNLDAITSQNTLIIEKDQTVNKLTIRQGGLEIHGTVGQAVVPEGHGTIVVRDCENLKESEVYDVLKEYIAEGYVGVKGRTTAGLWDIVPIVCKINTTPYGSLADAVAAVEDGQTITLTKDIENAAGIAIKTGKTFTIDFAGHKYTVNKPGAGSTGTQTAAFQLIKGQTITFKNGIIKAAEDNLTAAVAPAMNIKRMFQSYANVTLENMTIDGTNIYGNNSVCEFACGAVNINGTTSITTGKQGVAAINVDTWKDYYPEGAQVAISSTGEFGDVYLYAEETAAQFTKSSLTITNGKFSKVYGDDSGDWTASISGGVFSEKPDASLIAEHFDAVANTDPATSAKYPFTVKVKPVVKIGNIEYADIADAFAAVPTDGTATTVTLLENIGSKVGNEITWKEYAKTSVYKIKDGQNITFDLNGHKIYAKTTVDGYTCFFEVVNGGSLTFMDSVGGGELNYLDGKDNTGGLAIISYGKLIMQSGTVENHTKCNSSAIQGAIDVRANEWGAQYEHHSVFTMNGGVLKSNGDNTLRIYDSSQTGTGSVVVDFTINGGEVYGADAIFIQPAWTKTYSANDIYMNNFNISVTGGKFDTNNGIRVYGAVKETNNQTYRAIQISVTGGEFTIRKPSDKYRDGHIAYQNNSISTDEATVFLRSYTNVNWSANPPTYCQE